METKLFNILVLSIGFMLLFTAFQTMSNIKKVLLDSVAADIDEFTGDGYKALALIYLVFGFANWLAPPLIANTGPRFAIILGGSVYIIYMISFLYPSNLMLYSASVLLGISASILWTGQGNMLARCSIVSNIALYSGIFWSAFQSSLFFGNTFVYFKFADKDHIDQDTRNIVIFMLIALACLGNICFCCLKYVEDNSRVEHQQTIFQNIKCTIPLHCGIYGPAVGFTKQMHDKPKKLVGAVGIALGIGEVLGGLFFCYLGALTSRYSKQTVFIVGMWIHLISFLLIFCNIPAEAPFGNTDDTAIIDPPSKWLALFCAFLLGLGDACFNTRVFGVLGNDFVSDSVSAFAIFHFFHSSGAGVTYIYSSIFDLRLQLIILATVVILGTVCYCVVQNDLTKRQSQ